MNQAAPSAHVDTRKEDTPSCNTSMTFNFAVGVIAILVAVIVGFALYAYFVKG